MNVGEGSKDPRPHSMTGANLSILSCNHHMHITTNLIATLLALLLSFLLLRWIIRAVLLVVVVQHDSMLPTLRENDRVLVCKLWPIKWLAHGQIVILRPWNGTFHDETRPARKDVLYIKRIIALPGETVTDYANLPVWEWPPRETPSQSAGYLHSWYVPPGHVFVRGDNRTASFDSRFWGPAPFHSIVGIVISRLPTKQKQPVRSTVVPEHIRPTWGPPRGVQAPKFTVPALNGDQTTLSTYEGRSVAFIFASLRYSDEAHLLIQSLEEIAPKAAKHGVELALVSVADPLETAECIRHCNSTLPVLLAPAHASTFMGDYHILGWPSYCLLDEQGVTRQAGPLNSASGEWLRLVESWSKVE